MWNWRLLLKHIETAIKGRSRIYAGLRTFDRFCSGAGFLVSRDVAAMLVNGTQELIDDEAQDDVSIADYLRLHHQIECQDNLTRYDYVDLLPPPLPVPLARPGE